MENGIRRFAGRIIAATMALMLCLPLARAAESDAILLTVSDSAITDLAVLSVSYEFNRSGATHVGTGSGSGTVDARPLTIVRNVDEHTPFFLERAAKGNHIQEVTLSFTHDPGNTGSPVTYLQIVLTKVFVSGFRNSFQPVTGGLLPTEVLEFTYETVNLTSNHSPDGETGFGWNVSTNEQL